MIPEGLPAWKRRLVVLGGVLLVAVSASGARMVLPELHAVKCGDCRPRMSHLTDGRRSAALASRLHAPGGKPDAALVVALRPPRLDFLTTYAPLGAVPDATRAPFTALRAHLWQVVGGHGRLGPGYV